MGIKIYMGDEYRNIGTTNTPSFVKIREVTLQLLIWYGMTHYMFVKHYYVAKT